MRCETRYTSRLGSGDNLEIKTLNEWVLLMEAISLEDRLLALPWTSRCRGPGYQGLLSASSGVHNDLGHFDQVIHGSSSLLYASHFYCLKLVEYMV